MHIYKGRNLWKTPPTVAREGCRTLIFISHCEEVVLIRNQQEYRLHVFVSVNMVSLCQVVLFWLLVSGMTINLGSFVMKRFCCAIVLQEICFTFVLAMVLYFSASLF